mgnify:FL=1
MNKMVINSHQKLFVTNDAATIIKELDVVHPAAKMIVMASKQQEQEVGDGTNLVVIFAGELLQQAEALLQMGLHVNDVITGYTKAAEKALELLEGMWRRLFDRGSRIETSSCSYRYASAPGAGRSRCRQVQLAARPSGGSPCDPRLDRCQAVWLGRYFGAFG